MMQVSKEKAPYAAFSEVYSSHEWMLKICRDHIQLRTNTYQQNGKLSRLSHEKREMTLFS